MMKAAVILLCLLATVATAAPATAPPPFVWIHPRVTDMYAMTIVYGGGLDPERFGRITGRTGRVYLPLKGSEIAVMLGVLERAAAGPATCDSVMNDSRIWAVTLVDTTKSGSYKVRSTTSVPFGLLRCAALAQMAELDHKASLFYAFRQLSVMQPVPQPATDTPVMSPSRIVIEQMRTREDLIREAESLKSERNWSRIGFVLWTGRSRDGHGVRLTSGALPPLADDPMPPVDIHVKPATLRDVIAQFLGRREIEIASHFPREQSMRWGVNGWAGAIDSDSTRAWVVYGSHILPSEGEQLGRELVDFLSTREPAASRRVAESLGPLKPAPKLPPLAYQGPAPLAIAITPTTGEDLAHGMIALGEKAMRIWSRAFGDTLRPWPDADFSSGFGWMRAQMSDESMPAIAALLEEAAREIDRPCDPLPQFPAWPPTWRVRFFDSATDTSAHLVREFTVPVARVRCRALERFDALGRKGNPALRGAMESLSMLGVDQYAPDPPHPAPPQRLSPAEERNALLALARAEPGQVRTHALGLSFVGRDRIPVRLSTGPVFVDIDAHPAHVQVSEAAMRAALAAALSHPATVAGLDRTTSTYPRRTPRGEIRVLEHFPGMRYPIVRLIAYLTPSEATNVLGSVLAEVERLDPRAAEAIRDQVEGTDLSR